MQPEKPKRKFASKRGPKSKLPQREHAVLMIVSMIASEFFPGGHRAALRRLDTHNPGGPAFWELLLRYVPEDLRKTRIEESSWALLMKGAAFMAPSTHRQGARLGRVLAQIDYKEARLSRLLMHDAERFPDDFLRLCRTLAQKGAAVDWVRDMGPLVLGNPETSARRIGKDFYAAHIAGSPAEQIA